jgi:dihydrofolate reductase
MTTIIVAFDENRVIGANNGIPWDLPEDRKYFKECTMGHPVIMGRKTWESIPEKFRPLKGRANIVVSKTVSHLKGCHIVDNLELAVRICYVEPFIIGGASIYEQALEENLVDKIIATHVKGTYEGDVYFPNLEGWESEPLFETKDFEVHSYSKQEL